MEKGMVQREVRPVGNNAMRTNHQNFSNSRRNFNPTTVLTKSGIVPISTARQSSSRAAAPVSAARPINTVASKPLRLFVHYVEIICAGIIICRAGRLLGAYDLRVATPRAVVHVGDKTKGDARSWCVLIKLNGWFWRLKMCTLGDLGFKTKVLLKGYGPKDSKSVCVDISNEIKNVLDAPIIKDWVSDSDEDESEEMVLKSDNVLHKHEQDGTKTYVENMEKGMVQREVRPVGNNAMRTNHQNFSNSRRNFNPTTVLTKSGIVPISTARQSSSRAAAPVSAARPINTVASKPLVNVAKPRQNALQTSHSPYRRPFYQQTTLKNRNLNNNVNTVKANFVNTAKGNKVTSVVGNQGTNGAPHDALKDQGYFDSGCSRHMPRNTSYLTDFKEHDRGYVAFGRGAKGGKISGKGKINATKDETIRILKGFITEIENLVEKKVKIIKYDNGTEFKNRIMNEFCEEKGIKREFSMARTPQQNRVAERRNRTLIEAARTMLADSKLPTTFWAEAVNTACYVQNRVLVVKPHFKTPYELFKGRSPALTFLRPFGCHVIILNSLEQLGKFDGKSNEGIFVGYSTTSKAFRVYNIRTRKVEKNPHITFLEDKPMITGGGPEWLFDIDALLKLMNYAPVSACTNSNDFAGKGASFGADGHNKDNHGPSQASESDNQERPNAESSTKTVNTTGPVNTATPTYADYPNDPLMPDLEDDRIFDDAYDDRDEGAKADNNNLETEISVSPIPSTRIHKDHPKEHIIKEVMQNKARLVAQGHRQEKGIDYDEVFAPVARIKAIRLFLANASFMDFTVYQMDVKSAFLYGTIEKEVYVSQPLGFVDPEFPNKVYKEEKALYGLHQAPRAWYETLSTYLLDNGFKRRTIDKTLFINKIKYDILLVQVYVDDIIFGSTKRSSSIEFEQLIHKRIQMSSIGELTFFLGLQVDQQKDGIFLSQDTYVSNILKKFGFSSVKSISTPMKTNKPLSKDVAGTNVDVYLYRSMIGSLMYLTYSKPDIMFAMKVNAVRRTYYCHKKVNAAKHKLTTAEKPSESDGFKQIIDFLNANQIKYALTLQALIDGKKVVITEASIRHDLKLNDAESTSCLPNTMIFEVLERIGTMASAIICLANNQKFNFSKYILDNLKKNLEAGLPFYMFPRFLQVFVNHQIGDMSQHTCIFVNPSLTKNVFANMKRVGTGFSKVITPLFDTMMVQPIEEVGALPTADQDTPIPDAPSSFQPQRKHKPRRKEKKEKKELEVSSTKLPIEDPVPTTSNDPLLSGEDNMPLKELMVLCTNLSNKEENRSLTKELKSFNSKVDSLAVKETVVDKGKSSKQGRKITDSDVDAEVNLENVYNLDLAYEETVLSIHDATNADGKEVVKEMVEVITTAKIIVYEVSTAGSELNAADEDSVSAAPTSITTAKSSEATKTTVDISTTPKAKGIVFHDMKESTTRISSSKLQVKDKGKAKLVEEPKVLKSRKAQIAIDAEVAKRIEAEGSGERSNCQKVKGDELEKENAEKQKLLEQQEAEDLKRNLEIVPDDEDDVFVNVAPLSFKPSTIVDYKIYKEGKKDHFQIIRAN
uniref:Retrovirus-related Pol polyprotein from transposon TNT 1-94 n=1 Tax=Tanacetum cinerariifolium TaxID=118510 RepID=A0A6L2JXN8_TANCI|nr:retrovirus-related Pol polyprotein from transposon TNT 1-94 [Tanacetum cinerariifolium]